MDYALDRFEQQVRDAIIATEKVPAALIELTEPKPNIPADLALPLFRAAKELKLSPPQLAQELAAELRFADDALIGAVAATGPFLNFTLDTARLTAAVLEEIEELGPRYGSDDQGAGKTIVIDYSAPNIAKTMHVGHIRSTIIGQSLYNIFAFLGYRVIGDNHLGDWGKQFGVNLAAIVKWGRPEGEGEEAIAQIDKLYMQYSAMMKTRSRRSTSSTCSTRPCPRPKNSRASQRSMTKRAHGRSSSSRATRSRMSYGNG